MRIPSRALASAAAAAAVLLVASSEAAGKRPAGRRPATVVSVATPIGIQGLGGAGANVALPFRVADVRGAPTDVEVQYGFDRNADGVILDDEYRPATEDRLDPRDTRSDRSPQLFETGTDDGAAHGYVWRSDVDVRSAHLLVEYEMTRQGRLVPDPDDPSGFRRATLNGVALLPGMKFRVRAVRPATRHRRAREGAWVTSEAFAIDQRQAPSMTIDSVEGGPLVLAHWTVFDADSEDLNGNGLLDVADGEDLNGNGVLDVHRAGVAFDFCSLAPGQDVSKLTPAQLEQLQWRPCRRADGEGDNDSLETTPGLPIPQEGPLSGVATAPPGVGRSWTFAWDAKGDLGTVVDDVVLRATPFDETRARGKAVYWLARVHPGD